MVDEKPEIHIGIGAISLFPPLTGIGQYTLNLILELERVPDLRVALFYGPFWGDQIKFAAPREDAPTRRAMVPAVMDTVKRVVKSIIPRPHDVARFLQQRVFTKGAVTRGIMLYHEPNYIPYRFAGPVVITLHDLSLLKYPHTHTKECVDAIGRRLPAAVERADGIITVSEFTRKEVIETFGVDPAKVTTVYNGVGKAFRPMRPEETASVLQRHGLRHTGYILTVGTLEPRKNLIGLFRAYRRLDPLLRRHYPLVIVGMKGWHYREIEQELETLMASEQVRPLGYLNEGELPAVYAGAAVMVYPSLYEGFGLPPIEAMASGVPVVVSDRSSLPEVVGEAGWLIDPMDERDIAEGIQALLDSGPERELQIERGLDRARQFGWDRCARETLAVYCKVLRDSGVIPA